MIELPEFFVSKVTYFGISIDRTSLHAVEVDSKGIIRTSAEVIFSKEPFEKGVLVHKEDFISGLQTLLQKGQFSTSFVSVCFPEAYAYTRGLSIPKVTQEEIPEAVSWQVKDLFPLPEDQLYHDWRIIEELPTGYQLAVVAIQKHTLDGLIEALTLVGLHPVRFESGASVIARLLILPNNQYAVVTDINQNGSSVTLIRGEKTIFTTVVNYPTQKDDFEYVKHLSKTIQDVVGFYQKKLSFDESKLEIIITGEKATDQWVRSMKIAFPYPVKILHTTVDNPSYNKAYAAAVLRFAPPSDAYTINLLPSHVQAQYDAKQLQGFYMTLLKKFSIGMAIISIMFLCILGLLLVEAYRMNAAIALLRQGTSEDRRRVTQMREIESLAKDVIELAPLRKTPKDQINTIFSLLPKTIQITQWEYDDAKLLYTFRGIAQNRESLISFKTSLDQSNEFTTISLPLGYLESSASAHFVLSFMSKK